MSSLFQEYMHSTGVRNDPFDVPGTPEDRLANLAAHGTPDQLLAALLAASPCRLDPELDCPDGTEFHRFVLVEHSDQILEVMPLYVGNGSDLVVDSTGESYSGGLDDFRRNNDLLATDDLLLAPRDLSATSTPPSEEDLVVVSGHTTDPRRPWLIGGSLAAVAIGVTGLVLLFLLHRRSRDTEQD